MYYYNRKSDRKKTGKTEIEQQNSPKPSNIFRQFDYYTNTIFYTMSPLMKRMYFFCYRQFPCLETYQARVGARAVWLLQEGMETTCYGHTILVDLVAE